MKKLRGNLIGQPIPENLKEILNASIGMEEYKQVAKETRYSLSSVCNIVNQRVKLNRKNIDVVNKLIEFSRVNLHEKYRLIEDLLLELKTFNRWS